MIPVSYYYMAGWDEYFTFVQWDQRGAGKTYRANHASALKHTMSIERMVADTEELISYLRETYAKKRIVPRSRRASFSVSMQPSVSLRRNARAISDLERLAPYPDLKQSARNLQNIRIERPGYCADDLRARAEGESFGINALWNELKKVDFTSIARFECPLIFMHGRHDRSTSAAVLGEWYERLHAPRKALLWFEDSAHVVYEEEPGKVLVSLVQHVLPTAVPQFRSYVPSQERTYVKFPRRPRSAERKIIEPLIICSHDFGEAKRELRQLLWRGPVPLPGRV